MSALRAHLQSDFFAHLDLAGFYESVTDTKVYRALRRIGLPHSQAFKMTGESTVQLKGKRVLARGFDQSPLLADLVLDQSLVGSVIRTRVSSTISAFGDDIILSSKNAAQLRRDFDALIAAILKSNFQINQAKTKQPCARITAFNVELSHADLRISPERLSKFSGYLIEAAAKSYVWTCPSLEYVSSINYAQGEELLARISAGTGRLAPVADLSRLVPGTRVHHQRFATGVVESVEGNKVTAFFYGRMARGRKTVLADFLTPA